MITCERGEQKEVISTYDSRGLDFFAEEVLFAYSLTSLQILALLSLLIADILFSNGILTFVPYVQQGELRISLRDAEEAS